ncbi:MAG: cysteine desulfurase family protein, partial [Bacteroidota bacterium]
MRIYLDNAATTPIREEVIEAMLPIMRAHFGNPSSIHAEGRKVRAEIEKARRTVAKCINASIGEIFFTSGGTEANNMAIKGAVRDLGVTRIITSPLEHHCVLHAVDAMQRDCDIEVTQVQLTEKGYVDYAHLEVLLKNTTRKTLVSLMHANNEIGVLLDLERVSELCTENNALLHSDTVQTIGHFPIDVSKTTVHFLSGAGHKFHGPKGVGFIYINGDNTLKPFIDGGAQERNMRGGTENVYGIVGMATALQLANEELLSNKTYIQDLRSYMAQQLKRTFPDIHFHSDLEQDALYTVLSVSFPPSQRAEMLLLNLDIAGISVSGGSACSSGTDVGSHVIDALKGDPTRKTIRFSFSHYNTKTEIDVVLLELRKILPSG